MRILIFHGYLLRGTGSNIYNANLARALAGLGHEVHLFCQDRTALPPKGVTIHLPDIGRLLPVYVADRYEGFDAVPFPDIDEMALGHYLDANIAAVRSAPVPDIALANHLVMGPVILARGSDGTRTLCRQGSRERTGVHCSSASRTLSALRARRDSRRVRCAGGFASHGRKPLGGAVR